jgi:hypothetical protein
MAQATQASTTSRRTLLTGALAALPAVALASVPAIAGPDAALIALEYKLIEASAQEAASRICLFRHEIEQMRQRCAILFSRPN